MKRFRITHFDLQRKRRRMVVTAKNGAAALAEVEATFGEGWFFAIKVISAF